MSVEQRRGVVLRVAEADYRFGAGPLVLRIEHIDVEHPAEFDGELWYRVRGVSVGWDGADRGRCDVLIRATRIPGLR